ncbi:MAG: DUF6597 domain-containing transcriptional factor [Psychroflexus halocasei]
MEKPANKYKSYKIKPPKDFSEVFSHFYGAENHSKLPVTKILSPSFQTILVFNLSKNPLKISTENHQFTIQKCMVLGPLKKAIHYTIPAHSTFFIINFRDDAFYRFFNQSVLNSSFFENPDQLTGENCFSVLWQQLKKLDNPKKYVEELCDFSWSYLKERDTIVEKITLLRDQSSEDPIKAVAVAEAISKRTVQKRHKQSFGYTAKEIQRYQRFSNALHALEIKTVNYQTVDWFGIINQCGYYDQSQLIHDFQYFLSCTPSHYLKFQRDICFVQAD